MSKAIDSPDGEKPVEIVPLGLYWDEWSRCVSSRYQRDHLYRMGKLDQCSRPWKDLKMAMEAKVIAWNDTEKAGEIMESTYYKKRTTISPTAGVIWELKSTPSWKVFD